MPAERDDRATADRCPNCGEPLTALDGRDQGRGVERASCPTCALQLVRRDGGRWEGIRG